MSGTIKTFFNSRNEAASTDGTRWWLGPASLDEQSIRISELQPVSALFQDDEFGVSHRTAAKARSVFMSALRKAAPAVAPDGDAERAILRKAWDDAQAFASSHSITAIGRPVFDGKQMVVGTADVIYAPIDEGICTYCYAPDGYTWRGELNAVTRILYAGLPINASDDPHGHYTLRELSRALLALVTRCDTEWHKAHAKEMPI